MAVTRQEVDALADGLDIRQPNTGSFALNTFRETETHQVREGFGLLWESEPSARNPTEGAWGALRLLGCRSITTNFNHVQTVAVYRSRLMTHNIDASIAPGSYGDRYVVVVYDATTGQWFDEVLFVRTSEKGAQIGSITGALGAHTTNAQAKRDVPINAADRPVWFTEFQDSLLFGSADAGIWCYVPCDFTKNIDKSLDVVRNQDDASWRGESAAVIKIYPVNGLFADEYGYLGTDDFPAAVAATGIVGRVAYAERNRVYLSDVGKPASIMGQNVLTVPCDGDITALAEAGGSLLIMTINQTWLFRPTLGVAAAVGDLRVVSSSVGCLSANAVCKVSSSAVWIDRNGVFANVGDLNAQELSEPVRRMFTDEVASPLPHYTEASGVTTNANPQPRTYTRLTVADYPWATICFAPQRKLLIANFPTKRRALVSTEGQWSLWTFDSEMTTNGAVVGSDLVGGLVPHAAGDDVFAWSSPLSLTPSDRITPPGNNTASSMRLFQWGRGGALDNSSGPLDDRRELAGYTAYHAALVATSTLPGAIVIGKPVLLPTYSRMPRSGLAQADTYLFPVYLLPGRGSTFAIDNVQQIQLRFLFDNTQWKPVNTGTEVDFDLPTQRVASAAGWGPGAAVAGFSEVQIYDSGTAAPDANGDQIRMSWSGAVGGFSTAPNMAVNRNAYNPLILLPFQKIVSSDAMSLGISLQVCEQNDGVATYGLDLWEYHQGTRGQTEADEFAQAVDWALKSKQIGLDEAANFRLRSLYSRIMSHGSVSDIYAGPYGLFNVAYGSDGKDWSGQVVDFTDEANRTVEPGLNVRKRVEKSGVMEQKLFNNGLAWQDIMVSDGQHDMIATSTSLKGEQVSVMMFGYVQNRAGFLVIASAKVALEMTGQRRRFGR